MSISLFRAIANQYEDLRRVNSVAMMRTISNLIEDQVLALGQPIDFYAGFQRYSNFPYQMQRYARLGAVCRRVYVFGVADVEPPRIPGVQFVEIAPTSALAREWFLLVDTPEFWTALLTCEVEGRDASTGGRRYDGIWTYDQHVVDRASLLMSQILETYYQPVPQRNPDQQSSHIAEISGRLVSRLERSNLIRQRRWVQLCTLQKFSEALSKNQRITPLVWDTAQILRIIFGAADAAIAIRNSSGTYDVVSTQDELLREQMITPGEGPSGQALAEGRSIHVRNVHQGRKYDVLLSGVPTLIAAPIMGRRGVHGVLTVAGNRADEWNEEDVQTVSTLAGLLAGVLEHRDQAAQQHKAELAAAQRLEQAVVKLRRPMGHLLTLHNQWRDTVASDLGPEQQELFGQIDQMTHTIGRIIGVSNGDSSAELALHTRSIGE